MKTISTLIFLFIFSIGANAQLFEPVGFEYTLADTSWNSFANNPDDPADMVIVENPDKSGINPSDSVLQFTINTASSPWVGAWTDHYEPVVFTESEHILTMMVYKSVIGPCGLKVELSTNGGANAEVMVPNTKTDEWEMLSFDFSGSVGYVYKRLVFFPDFPATRTEGSIAYIDNIANGFPVSVKPQSGKSIKFYPNPVENTMYVQFPNMKSITISNLLGKTVNTYKFEVTSSKSLDLNGLQTGIYFISAETTTGTYTSKFMKK